jgi:hypothetical protein
MGRREGGKGCGARGPASPAGTREASGPPSAHHYEGLPSMAGRGWDEGGRKPAGSGWPAGPPSQPGSHGPEDRNRREWSAAGRARRVMTRPRPEAPPDGFHPRGVAWTLGRLAALGPGERPGHGRTRCPFSKNTGDGARLRRTLLPAAV